MHNPDMSYLMGMIVGKGHKITGQAETEFKIEIPHKSLEVEGLETTLSTKASLLDIKQRLDPVIDSKIDVIKQSKSMTVISFKLNNQSYLATEMNRMLTNNHYKNFRVPKEIFGATRDIKLEFLRGLSDVTGHIRDSNRAFSDPSKHRVYIEIPENWYLVVDICNLLKEVDIPVQTVNWGHPNFRDGNLKDYNRGRKTAWAREHQIKIFADVFEDVGFNIEHKKRALQKFAQTNRDNWKGKKYTIDESHRKFYWEKPIRENKKRPAHPMVNDPSIPIEIRSQNFTSWVYVAKLLGYQQ